ncbi:MAG: hypothetical protein K2P38_10450 [Lachnospiraceae bacterium]|nr:hypothetical protein [Lachnospiraceae bacterium]
MLCEKCKTNMIYIRENSVQGWLCPVCGWEILTTYIDKMLQDMTEYSVCIKNIANIDKDKIKVISQIAGVNYIAAKQILEKEGTCILKAKAIDIKEAICKLLVSKKFVTFKKPMNPSRFQTHPAVPELSALCVIPAVFLKA